MKTKRVEMIWAMVYEDKPLLPTNEYDLEEGLANRLIANGTCKEATEPQEVTDLKEQVSNLKIKVEELSEENSNLKKELKKFNKKK
jgi:predicted  nucleic acid-binding Zn-ribbon protein